jgi:hypothetical protein
VIKRVTNRVRLHGHISIVKPYRGKLLSLTQAPETPYGICGGCDCDDTQRFCHFCGAGQVFKEMSSEWAGRLYVKG